MFYESYYGVGALCNPHAIFAELIKDPDYRSLRHVWVLKSASAAPKFRAEYRDHPRVKFVRYRSWAYVKEMYRSRYLINNSTFPGHFAKRPGQTYLNTWHGTPLKKMGYHLEEDRRDSANIIRNFLMADYVLSANPHTTERMYLEGYRLEGLFRGKIIETGYPRIDLSLSLSNDREAALKWLRSYGVRIPEGARTVLVAPTWKGQSYYAPSNDAEDVAEFVSALQYALGAEYFVMVKMHQQVTRYARGLPDLAGRLIKNQVPANGALAAADVLVSDYSSIFFDYLPLNRPIAFYVPDSEEYESLRGTYVGPDDLPGPSLRDVDQVAAYIRTSATAAGDPYVDARRACAERFAPYDDGEAAKRVVRMVFGGAASPEVGRVVAASLDNPRILLHLGGMKPNGITFSGLNLLRNLDYENFDVSTNFSQPGTAQQQAMIAQIDPRARLLETPLGVAEDLLRARLRRNRGRVLPLGRIRTAAVIRRAFAHEWRRVFGAAEFDYVIDFSGYSARPAALMLAAPRGERSIWLHNDIASDRAREVNGVMPHYTSLTQTVSLYPHFDNLVSVSRALAEVNHRSYGLLAGEARFTFAHNTIDATRVLELARLGHEETESRELEGVAPRLRRARARALNPTSPSKVFVTAGRLSPEKNHERLIDAFALVLQSEPECSLVIVGDGPLRQGLAARARLKGISDRVMFVGQTDNPFAYMARSGCFVMSSDYEGQPMVVLEARTLGLPVVSTDYASVASVIDDTCGIVVGRSHDALAVGMLRYLAGEVPRSTLDPDAYNAEAMTEFYGAVGARRQ